MPVSAPEGGSGERESYFLSSQGDTTEDEAAFKCHRSWQARKEKGKRTHPPEIARALAGKEREQLGGGVRSSGHSVPHPEEAPLSCTVPGAVCASAAPGLRVTQGCYVQGRKQRVEDRIWRRVQKGGREALGVERPGGTGDGRRSTGAPRFWPRSGNSASASGTLLPRPPARLPAAIVPGARLHLVPLLDRCRPPAPGLCVLNSVVLMGAQFWESPPKPLLVHFTRGTWSSATYMSLSHYEDTFQVPPRRP